MISIDWITKVISIPKADMTLIQTDPFEIHELDLDEFRLSLKSIEESEEGMPYLDTHRHNTEVVLGGITLARVIEIINGYTVTFEDGQYAVNAIGANSNIADVLNLNQVSLRSFNSAGLQVVSVGSGLSQEEHDKLMATADEDGERLTNIDDNVLSILSDTGFIKDINGGKWEISADEMIFYKDDNITEVARFTISRDAKDNPIMRTRE